MIIVSALNTIFYMINGVLGILSQLLMFGIIIYKSRKKQEETLFILIQLIIASVPTSFINIFGGNYGDLPISWFNLILIYSLIYILARYYIRNKIIDIKINLFILTIFSFIICYFMEIFITDNIMSGLSSFLTVCMPMIFILLILSIKINIESQKLVKIYIDTVIGSSIGLIFQIIMHNFLGIRLGCIEYMNNRIAFAGIFTDFSFYSVYLASAAGYLIVNVRKNKNKLKERVINIIYSILLITSSLLTSARSGIMSMILAFIILIFLIILFGNVENKIKVIITLPILFIVAIISLNFISQLRGESQGIFGDSGRSGTYEAALCIFKDNTLFGIGPGIENYQNYVNKNFPFADSTIPHNFIMQNLAQLGLVGTLFILIIITNILYLSKKIKNKDISIMFLITLISNFVLPDMLNTRYIFTQIILIIASYKFKKLENESIKCN